MKKFLIVPHEFAGFGAIIDRKIITTKIANEYDRIPIFLNTGWPYDDPYSYEYSYEEVGKATSVFNYSNQQDQVVLFDTNHWIQNLLSKSFKKRKVYEEGRILSSFILKKQYQDIINSTLQKIPQITESVSLHIRRGDKNDPNQEPFPYYTEIDDYIKTCIKISEQYGYNSVYINSDSLFAIEEACEKLEKIGFSCYYDIDQQRYDMNQNLTPDNKFSASKSAEMSKQETQSSIKVIYTMAKSKHVIGMNNVQFTKLASFLLTYNSNANLGYTWLDSKTRGKNISYTIS